MTDLELTADAQEHLAEGGEASWWLLQRRDGAHAMVGDRDTGRKGLAVFSSLRLAERYAEWLPGSGWATVETTPAQAREIAAGKPEGQRDLALITWVNPIEKAWL